MLVLGLVGGGPSACAWIEGGQGATVIYCAPVGPCIMAMEEYEEDNETNTHCMTI